MRVSNKSVIQYVNEWCNSQTLFTHNLYRNIAKPMPVGNCMIPNEATAAVQEPQIWRPSRDWVFTVVLLYGYVQILNEHQFLLLSCDPWECDYWMLVMRTIPNIGFSTNFDADREIIIVDNIFLSLPAQSHHGCSWCCGDC